jgi:8-hydroxy-5-deazaflavin:NADPH oxidoreductase
MTAARPVIGVVGGTGALGSALAVRWARSGYAVIIGSRIGDKSVAHAYELAQREHVELGGASNTEAAQRAEIVVVTVPAAAQEATLAEIRAEVQGKIVVDTTVPLVPPKVMRVQLPAEGSAAARAQRLLGDRVQLVSAFHNVAAHKLARPDAVDCDVLVFGDRREARDPVIALAEAAGLRGLHAGSLANSAAAEALTSVLIWINKHYAVDGAGIRITGALRATPVDS